MSGYEVQCKCMWFCCHNLYRNRGTITLQILRVNENKFKAMALHTIDDAMDSWACDALPKVSVSTSLHPLCKFILSRKFEAQHRELFNSIASHNSTVTLPRTIRSQILKQRGFVYMWDVHMSLFSDLLLYYRLHVSGIDDFACFLWHNIWISMLLIQG